VIQTLKQALTAPNKEDLGLAHDFFDEEWRMGREISRSKQVNIENNCTI